MKMLILLTNKCILNYKKSGKFMDKKKNSGKTKLQIIDTTYLLSMS